MQRVVTVTGKRICTRAAVVTWRSPCNSGTVEQRCHSNTQNPSYHSNTRNSGYHGYNQLAFFAGTGLLIAASVSPEEKTTSEDEELGSTETSCLTTERGDAVVAANAEKEEVIPAENAVPSGEEVVPSESLVPSCQEPPAEELAALDKIYDDMKHGCMMQRVVTVTGKRICTRAAVVSWRSPCNSGTVEQRCHSNTQNPSYHSNTRNSGYHGYHHRNNNQLAFFAGTGLLIAASVAHEEKTTSEDEELGNTETSCLTTERGDAVVAANAEEEVVPSESLEPSCQDLPGEELAALDKIYDDMEFELLETALIKYDNVRSAEVLWRKARY
eukprot:sb/3466703/